MARDYPIAWEKFCKIEKIHGGFTCYNFKAGTTIGDLNRFAARYALAKDFNGIIINNSTQDTMLGYEALMRSLFVWSVSEAYHNILPTGTPGKYEYLTFDAADKLNLRTSLNAVSSDLNVFFGFISLRVNSQLAPSVKAFLAGNDFNPMKLLASIRHVFSHGDLSANVKGVNPNSINYITKILKNTILDKIDIHFTSLVQSHPNA
jgi:hypothetical protein